ncbi:MAG: hypothetical protein RLY12_611 [Verrucomicrobiota bacterium]|jgi:hypothetical protein
MNFEDPSSSPRTLEHRLLRLLQAARDTQDASARAELNMLLRDNPEARPIMARLMVDEQALISRLREDVIVELLEPTRAQQTTPPMRSRWLAWRPLTAVAAGILFGLFGASMVFGVGVRWTEKVTSLFQESFESGPAPSVTGVPQQLNQWSGDFSELVSEQQGIKPAHGTKMIRMLRSDFDGKKSSRPSFQGDLMRIIDVRSLARDIEGGEALVSASVALNAADFPQGERHEGFVTLYALEELGSKEENLLRDSLAHSVGRRVLDRDTRTWQPVATRLQLPSGTGYVLVKVSFRRWPDGQTQPPDTMTYSGHFLDDVRASIHVRKAVSDRRD